MIVTVFNLFDLSTIFNILILILNHLIVKIMNFYFTSNINIKNISIKRNRHTKTKLLI